MRKDILIYFSGKAIPAVVNLAIIILAVRLIGKEEYGKYSLVFYATMLLSTLTIGWIQQGILRFLSAYPGEETLISQRFFSLTLVSSLVAILAGSGICIFYFHLRALETGIVILYLFFYNFLLFHLTLNQTRKKPFQYALLEGGYSLLFLLLFLLLAVVFNGSRFIVLFVAMLAALIINEILRTTLCSADKGGVHFPRFQQDRAFTRKVFQFGFPVTIWLFLSYLLNISDRFIIKEFISYESTGTYAAIKDLIIKISTFSTLPVLLAYHPRIVEQWNRNQRKEAIQLIREGLGYCLAITFIIMVIFLLFNNIIYTHILHLAVKNPWQVSVTLLLSAFLWQAALLVHKPLELLLKPGFMLVAILVALAVNGVGNLLLVPLFGYPAAALVSLVSVVTYLIVIFAFLFYCRRKGKFFSTPSA